MNAQEEELKTVLWERVRILEESQVITKKAADFARRGIDLTLQRKPDAVREKAEMFITHLAMAAMRAEQGTEENPVDPELLQEVAREEAYGEAIALRDEILGETGIVFPRTEKDFLTVHLCSLLSQ